MITPPTEFIRVMRRGADGRERIVFIGYISEKTPRGGQTEITVREPEQLILDAVEVPYGLPLGEHILERGVFDFWWKQLEYAVGLPDPRAFSKFPIRISPADRRVVERYVQVTEALAGSALLNAVTEGFNVVMPDGPGGLEEIEKNFSRTDVQAGFAVLLRQCDAQNEPARFEAVRAILWRAADAASDEERASRLEQLGAWREAVLALHRKSINQLIREKLAREEGLRAFEFREEHSPEQLLSAYNYGELIHWDRTRDVVAQWAEDDYIASDRRMAYLDAAAALAHVYIGFGELARSALGDV